MKKAKNSSTKFQNGFTLVEMLISISILMLFLGVIAGSYIALTSANKSANDTQKIYREIRNVFDVLAAEIRSGQIDYSCINELCIENNGGRWVFKFKNNQILVAKQFTDFQPITSENFKIDDFSFKIFPLKNPYDAVNAADDLVQYQPSVTIFLKTHGQEFRTTYSSRSYGKNIKTT